MTQTLSTFIDHTLSKMRKAELDTLWKEIHKKQRPPVNKEETIQQIACRIHALEFPLSSRHISAWLTEVYRTYHELRKTQPPSLIDTCSLIDMAEILTYSMSRHKKEAIR